MDAPTPLDIVQEQVDAYNAGDLERFLACYAPDVVILDGVGAIQYEGREAMRVVYGPLFAQNPALHAEIPSRIHVGQWIVDEEVVTGINQEGAPIGDARYRRLSG